MFTTSLMATMVAGLFASGSIVGLPDWADSYGKAMAQAGEKNKPVAVFLAVGDLNTLTNGKGLGSDALKSLKADYIAVRIDTTTADGQRMVAAFGITQGVILSDRSGKQMALKHEGTLTPEQASEYLAKYATVSTVSTTEYRSAVAPVVSYQQAVYQQQQPAIQYHQPVYQQYEYQQPRPVLNAIQNVGGAIQNVGGAIQNVGGMMFSPFVGGS